MKTYAVCDSAEELRGKLTAYYDLQARQVRDLIKITSSRRDCVLLEAKALGLEKVAAELRGIEILPGSSEIGPGLVGIFL